MTVYAGEATEILVDATVSPTASFPSGLRLTGDDGVTAKATVWGRDGEQVHEGYLAWDATIGMWKCFWDTTGLTHGTYQIRVKFEGPGALKSWEYKNVTLARDKAPAPPTP